MTLAAARRRRGGGGSISGGGGIAKRGGGAQRDRGCTVAAGWMLWRWPQQDSATLAAAWQWCGGGSAKRGGGAQCDGGSAVAAGRMLQRWQQRDKATLMAAWRWHGGGGSVSGGGSSAKCGGSAQRGSCSAVAARRRLRWICRHRPRMRRHTRLQMPPRRQCTPLCPWLRTEGRRRQRHCCHWQ